MEEDFAPKSSVEEIRQRFDQDVARFSRLDTGQQSTIDAALTLELITSAAQACCPAAQDLLDIGCGAGNFSLKLLEKLPGLSCHLTDLSAPMLEAAQQRLAQSSAAATHAQQKDLRELELEAESVDIVLAGAVLHHLRSEEEWDFVFRKLFQALRPGGCLWISDLVLQEIGPVDRMMWQRYGHYLEALGGPEYRQKVFDYIRQEDSPRPLTFQLDKLRQAGFSQVDVLHKNSCFAAFGGVK